MEIKNTDIIEKFRSGLSVAAGASFSTQRIVEIATDSVAQCLVITKDKNGSRDWLESESVQNSLLFGAYLLGDKRRKFDRTTYVLTHSIAVAHLNYNNRFLIDGGYDMEFAAIAGLNHDWKEELTTLLLEKETFSSTSEANKERKKLTYIRAYHNKATNLMTACWVRDDMFKSMIATSSENLTDSVNLHGPKRMEEQVMRAKNGMSDVDRITRYNDKMANAISDLFSIQAEKITGHANILKAAEMAQKKMRVVKEIPDPPVSNADRKAYYDVVSELFRLANNDNLCANGKPVSSGNVLASAAATAGMLCTQSFGWFKRLSKKPASNCSFL